MERRAPSLLAPGRGRGQALFAAANVVHWETFVSADIVLAGCFTTAMHLLFVALQCLAARASAAASAGTLTAAVETAY